MSTDNSRFRGNWSPHIANPTPQRFIPVPPPARPKKKVEEPPEKEELREAVSIAEPKDRLTGPPEGAEVKLSIRDRYNDYRGYIATDGACYNNVGDVIGYIEGNSAGSIDMEYLGNINGGNQIEDDLDELVGRLDPGRAVMYDSHENLVVELSGAGEAKGEDGSYLGQFEGFSYHDMKSIALYMFLIDPSMVMTYDEEEFEAE